MRNLILLFFFAFVLFSCSMPGDGGFEFDNPKFNNMSDACEWIYKNIKYEKDSYDDWKLPQETLDDKEGDCEDQAILLMAIMKYQKGYNSELVIVNIDSSTSHAIVRNGEKYYDPTNGGNFGECKYQIVNRYDYDSVMNMARYVKNY